MSMLNNCLNIAWQWYVANVKGKKRDCPERKEAVFPEVIDGCVSSPNYLKCPGEKEWASDVLHRSAGD